MPCKTTCWHQFVSKLSTSDCIKHLEHSIASVMNGISLCGLSVFTLEYRINGGGG